jgi:hypothetical protein
MVWPFKKQREDLDLTILAKRGLLKAPKQEQDLDLTQQRSASTDSGMGFFGAMSAVGQESAVQDNLGPSVGSNKIDDIEYKMDAISRRLNTMIDRLDLVEKKVDRLERHGV